MPANPKGSCLLCRIAKDITEKATNNMRKHVMIYAFFYLLLLELGSFIIRENTTQKDYDKFWFPLLVQFSFFVIFLNLFLFRKLLKFCKRKSFVIGTLSVYYLINFITILFPICNSTYVFYISIFLLIVIYVVLLQTIYQNSKK